MIPAFYSVSRAMNTIRYCEPALNLIDEELKKNLLKIEYLAIKKQSFLMELYLKTFPLIMRVQI